jgi:peptidoglycan/xylan/chitin deacetylase (PgdA/CDA1 family)
VYVGIAASCLPLWSVGALGAVGSSAVATASQYPGGVSAVATSSANLTPPSTPSRPSRTPMPTFVPTPAPTFVPTPAPYRSAAVPAPDKRRIYHVPILMYHRVVPVSEAGKSMPHLVVPPAIFALQMKAFSDAGWHTITMATLAQDMETNVSIPARTFVITFDDGWYDGFDYAFPIMRDYGFVGTYYVIGSRIGRKDFLSADQLRTLEAAGDDIGNHTEDHFSLPGNSADRIRREVDDASREIQQAVGQRPVTLAYPMGGVNAFVMQSVMLGVPDIKLAVTTWYGAKESWQTRLSTPRVRVDSTTDGPGLVASLSAA